MAKCYATRSGCCCGWDPLDADIVVGKSQGNSRMSTYQPIITVVSTATPTTSWTTTPVLRFLDSGCAPLIAPQILIYLSLWLLWLLCTQCNCIEEACTLVHCDVMPLFSKLEFHFLLMMLREDCATETRTMNSKALARMGEDYSGGRWVG